MTSEQLRLLATTQLTEIGLEAEAILVEPTPRNTAPAVLSAALWLLSSEDDPIMLVAPSDHVIPDQERFRATVAATIPAVEDGKIVTFGIVPTRPETGYGYLELGPDAQLKSGEPQKLARFVEKPDATRAAEMLASGNYLWNAGIFLFRARTIVDAFTQYAPRMIEPVRAALKEAMITNNIIRLSDATWSKTDSISIDYAVMEKSENLALMPFSGRWSDLGSWQAVWEEGGPDEVGNVTSGNTLAMDCQRSMLRSESDAIQLVGIGLQDIIAVATSDAVLIAHSSNAQRVKDAAQELKARGAKQASSFSHEVRPWGSFESLSIGPRFHVKRILVNPGGILSLQSHRYRAEHWVVVQGTARVTIDQNVSTVAENQSVYIPLGAIHRLENPTKELLIVIEVQSGSYFGEDDITRYEDVYSRA